MGKHDIKCVEMAGNLDSNEHKNPGDDSSVVNEQPMMWHDTGDRI
jgi:hypothetical protein